MHFWKKGNLISDNSRNFPDAPSFATGNGGIAGISAGNGLEDNGHKCLD